jgi:hypothetical protein
MSNTIESNPSSLVYICLKRIKELNPLQSKEIFARYDTFGDMEYVMKCEKILRNNVKNNIEYHSGIIYGGVIRD